MRVSGILNPPCLNISLRACIGARALCCSRTKDVESLLTAAPRCALHKALAECSGPAAYFGSGGALAPAPADGQEAPAQMGMSPDMEDAAIAYRLLMEV